MKLLHEEASGLRHLRWGREVLGALRALAEEPWLEPSTRAVLELRVESLASCVQELSSAVKPYRDWLERERTLERGKRRLALGLARLALRESDALEPSRDALEEGNLEALQCARAALSGVLDLRAEVGEPSTPKLSAPSRAREALEKALATLHELELPRERQLRRALDEAVQGLRAELEGLRSSLSPLLPAELVEALYPALSEGEAHVLDRLDPHDDASRAH